MFSGTTIIEGIGDEVVIVLCVLLVCLCLLLAWLSTRVNWDMRPLTILIFHGLHHDEEIVPGVEGAVLITSGNQTDPILPIDLEESVVVQGDQSSHAADAEGMPPGGADSAGVAAETAVHSHGEERIDTDCVVRHRADVQQGEQVLPPQDTQREGEPQPTTPSPDQLATPELQQQLQPQVQDTPETLSRPPGAICLRLKYFDERQRNVYAHPTDSVVNFKRKHFHQELAQDLNVRLIFNGRELREEAGQRLDMYSLQEDSTIHCLVTPRRRHPDMDQSGGSSAAAANGSAGGPGHQGSGQASEMDIGGFMFPIFGAILGVIWYCRVCYRQYFNVMSTFALVGITLLFFVAGFTCWSFRGGSAGEQGSSNGPLIEGPPIRIHRINLQQRQHQTSH